MVASALWDDDSGEVCDDGERTVEIRESDELGMTRAAAFEWCNGAAAWLLHCRLGGALLLTAV